VERWGAFKLMNRLPPPEIRHILKRLAALSAPNAQLALAEPVPALSQGLSSLVEIPGTETPDSGLLERVRQAEGEFWAGQASLESLLAGFTHTDDQPPQWRVSSHETIAVPRRRLVDGALLDSWFGSKREGSWASHMLASLGEPEFTAWRALARERLAGQNFDWPVQVVLIKAERIT
jgi:hypothetical protein